MDEVACKCQRLHTLVHYFILPLDGVKPSMLLLRKSCMMNLNHFHPVIKAHIGYKPILFYVCQLAMSLYVTPSLYTSLTIQLNFSPLLMAALYL